MAEASFDPEHSMDTPHTEPATGAHPQAHTLHYQTDPQHTFVIFEVRHFNTSTVRARFDRVSGQIELDRSAQRGRAEIALDPTSVNSGIAEFDRHLCDERFFDTAHHREVRFIGTDFSFDGDAVTAVAGELTLLGQTHPVTLRALHFNCYDSPIHHARVCGGDFEATIQRSQWGMRWGLEFGLPDAVHLLIQIEAIAQ